METTSNPINLASHVRMHTDAIDTAAAGSAPVIEAASLRQLCLEAGADEIP